MSVDAVHKRRLLLRSRMVRYLFCKDQAFPISHLESEMCRYYADRTFSHDEVRRWVRAVVNTDPAFVKTERVRDKMFSGQPVVDIVISLQEHCRHPKCIQRRVHNR